MYSYSKQFPELSIKLKTDDMQTPADILLWLDFMHTCGDLDDIVAACEASGRTGKFSTPQEIVVKNYHSSLLFYIQKLQIYKQG